MCATPQLSPMPASLPKHARSTTSVAPASFPHAHARVSTKTRYLHHYRLSSPSHSPSCWSFALSLNEPVMPSAVATKVQGPPGPRMHTPGEDGVGVGTGLIPPQMPAALLGIPQ